MLKVNVEKHERNEDVKAGQVRYSRHEDYYVLIVTDGYGKFNGINLSGVDLYEVSRFETAYISFVEAAKISENFPIVVDAELTIKDVMN